MPCTRGMTGCRPDCGHRRFVNDYRRERAAQATRAENASGGHQAELEEFFGAGGRPVEDRLVFRTWLRQHAGADYPYPSTWGMPLTLVQDLELSEWAYHQRKIA